MLKYKEFMENCSEKYEAYVRQFTPKHADEVIKATIGKFKKEWNKYENMDESIVYERLLTASRLFAYKIVANSLPGGSASVLLRDPHILLNKIIYSRTDLNKLYDHFGNYPASYLEVMNMYFDKGKNAIEIHKVLPHIKQHKVFEIINEIRGWIVSNL